MPGLDFESDSAEARGMEDLTAEQLQRIARLGNKQLELEQQVADAEKHLKTLKSELFTLTSSVIPEIMKEVGMMKFTMEDGSELEVKHHIKAAISQKNREAAFKWLRDNEAGDIIKNNVIISFGKGEDDRAHKAIQMLSGLNYSPTQKESVHGNTLTAYVRERLEAGDKKFTQKVQEMLGVFEYDTTKITKPKKKK